MTIATSSRRPVPVNGGGPLDRAGASPWEDVHTLCTLPARVNGKRLLPAIAASRWSWREAIHSHRRQLDPLIVDEVYSCFGFLALRLRDRLDRFSL